MRKKSTIPLLLIFIISNLGNSNVSCSQQREKVSKGKIKIKYFIKIGEIGGNFRNEELNHFLHIDDICCDENNNLYVVDSGWNKIFKFNSQCQYITSFGSEGQGPGEIMGSPNRASLKISYGNDKNIYIVDSEDRRLSTFTPNGNFIKSFKLEGANRDKATVNSKGDIYLLSNRGQKVIDCYDKNLHLKESFLNIESHFKFPIYKPKIEIKENMGSFFKKVITKDDHLIGLSNFSLTAFHFNEENKLLNKFKIDNKIFKKDFKKRLKLALNRDRTSFISPFKLFLDNRENLCIIYYNSSIENWDIYRYRTDSNIIDILRYLEENIISVCADRTGNFYAIMSNKNTIGKFKIY